MATENDYEVTIDDAIGDGAHLHVGTSQLDGAPIVDLSLAAVTVFDAVVWHEHEADGSLQNIAQGYGSLALTPAAARELAGALMRAAQAIAPRPITRPKSSHPSLAAVKGEGDAG